MIPSSPVLKGLAVELPELEIAKDQPEYIPLPALVSNDFSGTVTTRWQLSWRERFRVLWTGDIWVQMMCFHKPTTPVKVLAKQPPVWECL
jgi:hypothetical protein